MKNECVERILNKVDKEIAERLKKARQDKKLSQPKLAKELGIAQQTISSNEGGKTKIRASYVWMFAKFFGKRVDEFYPD